MRCHRCHAKIDPSKKSCPVCGTLVRKRRGAVKLAPETGVRVSRLPSVTASIKRIDSKVFLAVGLIAVIIILAVLIANCSSCSGCASCDACTSCDGCSSCSSCSNPAGETQTTTPKAVNSFAPSREYYYEGVLYYVSGDRLMAQSSSGEETIIAQGSGITNVYSNGVSVWYLQEGCVWETPVEKPLTVSEDLSVMYASRRLIDPTASNSDTGLTRVSGFALSGDAICYWGANESGTSVICVCQLTGGSERVLHTGSTAFIQCYRGSVYYLSRDEADSGLLFGIDLASGEKRRMYESTVNYYAPCNGSLFVYTWVNSTGTLHRININTLIEDKQWSILEIKDMASTDSWIYYYTYTEQSGELYRIAPDGSGNKKVFYDDSRIQLGGISGDWFSTYIRIGDDADNRYTNAKYYIINSETGEQMIIS